VIDEPARIRLQRIADARRSSRFPPGHLPMNSFLGVPIRVRDEVLDELDLTESTRDVLTAEDEELVTALAAAAGHRYS
jgi:GAF domain-containing protein